MSSATLQFELVSPEKLLISKDVSSVSVPGSEGVYGVLPGHAPMVTTVAAGVIETFVHGHAPDERIFVAGGFAEVTQERCTVLAEEAIPVAELDRAKIKEALRHAKEKVHAAAEEDRPALQAKQAILEAKLMATAA